MKKKQRKFAKVFEIDVAIIKEKKRAAKKISKADAMMVRHHAKMRESESSVEAGVQKLLIGEAEVFKRKSERLRQNYHFIMEKKIPSLVRTRAALQTMPMEFLGDDAGVVEENIQ